MGVFSLGSMLSFISIFPAKGEEVGSRQSPTMSRLAIRPETRNSQPRLRAYSATRIIAVANALR